MKRRCLIIYCDNTPSGNLAGPVMDFENYRDYLQTHVGGEWYLDEIKGLQNPTKIDVIIEVIDFMSDANYSFIIFTGHGYINSEGRQCMEVMDGNIMISDLKTPASRQTIVIDACREKQTVETIVKAEEKIFSDLTESILRIKNTRAIFDNAVLSAPEGLSILYAAGKGQSALNTEEGAAYLLSLIKVAENWRDDEDSETHLNIREAHLLAVDYLRENFEETIQSPTMNKEKRLTYFPFAVKNKVLSS